MSKTNNPYWPFKAPSRIDIANAPLWRVEAEVDYCEHCIWELFDDPSGIVEAYEDYLKVLHTELARRG